MQQVHFDSCIIGAGVIGLAIARQLARAGRSTIILEQAGCIGSGISSRNSEVIHGGLYYAPNSLKAQLCVHGKHQLYQYCEQHRVPHRRIGKLIVARSSAQGEALQSIADNALENGVSDLEHIPAARLKAMEPEVAGCMALLSPSTGIIDGHALMQSLCMELEQHGGLLSLHTRFQHARFSGDHFDVTVSSVGEPYHFRCTHLINAAGLQAQSVAARIEAGQTPLIPPLHYCKGSYFALHGPAPFSRLIYPLPEPNTTGLGIHATLDLAGQVRFGPDTDYVTQVDYQVEPSRKARFIAAIKHYYPGLMEARLVPAYAGIRPKLQGPSAAPCDFRIDVNPSGVINLFGIESPGLTAALAIAERGGESLAGA